MAQTPLLDADFFKYGNVMPYVFEKDGSGTRVSPSLAYIKNASGFFVPVSAADPMPMTAGASMVTPAVILQNGVGATGAGTPMNVAGLATVALTLSGTFVATVTFEVTTVATNPQPADWFLLNVHQSGTTNPPTTTATAPGIYRSSVAGFAAVRARVSAWTSGTVTVIGTAVAVEDTSKVVAATLTGRTPTIVTLQNAATAVGVGTPFTVGGNTTFTFEVAFSGTATGTVVIQGAETSGTVYNLGTVINLTTNTVVSQITASGLYQVDITGLDKVQANIPTVTPGTGNISVNGKVVA